MLEIKNAEVYDLKASVIASRNAMRLEMPEYTEEEFKASLPRAIQLANTPNGSGHQNFLKGIRVSFDIKYPNYISPELQRYNWIDIVTSSSKMHRLLKMDLNKACNKYVSATTIAYMNSLIEDYNQIANGESEYGIFFLRDGSQIDARGKNDMLYHKWMQILSNCPQGIELFMRVSTNYAQLKTIWHQRKHHKLREDWGAMCEFIEQLPYAKEFGLCSKD
jgi:hypothetical protein